ncbi:hypothetical protein LTR85_004224 [Meristemomyces frigidus]|nr:hypothetical protein LTR85_004224 [Meristemomyces frigidus]
MFYQLRFFDPSASDSAISTQAGILIGAKTAAQVCVACIGYGFSTTFTSAVAWQVFGGATNSNVAIVRCVVAELNPEKRYRTRALLLLPLSANVGMLIGPLIGGILTSKSGDGLFHKYPYAPPNLCIAAIYALAAVGVLFSLEETLESLQHGRDGHARRLWRRLTKRIMGDASVEHTYTAIDIDEPVTTSSPTVEPGTNSNLLPKRTAKLPFWRIWTFNVVCTMLAHFIIAGHLGTFANLWAIFLSTPVGSFDKQHLPFRFDGGLGMQPRDVGFAMSLLGAIGVVLQAAVYPMLNDRHGTVKIWRYALFVFPVVYLLAPFPSLVASASSSRDRAPLVWLAMSFVLLLFVLGRTGVVPATTLLLNDCTPHPSVRGTIHTAGTVVGSLSRSIFPVAALAIFGKGLEIGVVGLGFWFIACLAILACVASQWVKEGSNGNEIKLEGDTNSFFGRMPGYLGENVDRFNIMTIFCFFTAILTLALWLPARSNADTIYFAGFYGFGQGLFASMATALVAQISPDVRKIGVRTGVVYAIINSTVLFAV